MRGWRRFHALTAADRQLAVEAAALCVLLKVGLSIISFQTLRRVLHRYSAQYRSTDFTHAAERIASITAAVARLAPRQSTCLIVSLVAETMLRRRGYAPELRLGVRRRCAATSLDAHAWVECDGRVLVGAVDDLREYAALSKGGAA